MADLSITAANVAKGAGVQVGFGTAGVSITQGQVLCVDPSGATSNIYLAKASGTIQYAICIGIALNSALAGQPIEWIVNGEFTVGATVAKGTMYVVSANSGNIAPYGDLTTGNYCSLLGIADTTTTFTLNLWNTGVIHA